MNIDDLRQLADRADGVEGRTSDRLAELHSRIRRARQRRAGAGAAATAGVVVAAVALAAATLSGTNDRNGEPADRRSTETVSTALDDVPRGQVTIEAEIGAHDIQGWELKASRTNRQADVAGATDLSLTAVTGGLYEGQSYVGTFCNGDPDTSWVLTMDLGGEDGAQNPDGSMQNGSRGSFGSCSPDGPSALSAPTGTINPWQWDQAPMAYPIRMFLTDDLSLAAQHCLSRTEDTDACLTTYQLRPLEDTDATFGFGVYEHHRGPAVLDILGGSKFEALAVADGVEYLVDRAVVSAVAAPRLVVHLPESDHPRIVAVFEQETSADCDAALGHEQPTSAEEEQAQVEEFDRRCGTDLRLRIDGAAPPGREPGFSFAEHQAVLPPGAARDVTVDVVRGDPRNVRYAIVVWEARS